MPNKCSVAGCRSNYDTQKEYKTLFSLPKDDEKKKKWLRKIPTDFSGLKNPFICIEHFHECDIIRVDEVCVNGVLKQYPRKVPKLKDDAIPSVFPNLPKYLSVNSQLSRRLVDVEQSNFDLATRQSILDQNDYEEKQAIKEVSGILSYFKLLNEKEFPSKWDIQQNSEKLYISLISVNATPVILGHIEVYTNLKFDMYVNKCKVAHSRLPKNTVHINSINILESLLLFLEQEVHKPIEPTALNQVIDILKLINHEEEKKIEFIIDQLKLLQVPKNNRRYCNETVVLSASLYVHSASSYCAVYKCGSFCLPHPRNMQKLISKFSLSSSSLQGSISYLKTKFKCLKEHEILVNLLLDEIYIEPQLNFKAGRIYGSTDSDPTKTAKTAQVFMISSILSSYKDVVCITPVINLTSDLLQSMLLTVIKEVEQIGFKVICLISDNNVINRKAFELLTPNKLLQPVIPHPFDPERQLFILFDSVHILKCIRNNWLNSKNNGTLTFPEGYL